MPRKAGDRAPRGVAEELERDRRLAGTFPRPSFAATPGHETPSRPLRKVSARVLRKWKREREEALRQLRGAHPDVYRLRGIGPPGQVEEEMGRLEEEIERIDLELVARREPLEEAARLRGASAPEAPVETGRRRPMKTENPEVARRRAFIRSNQELPVLEKCRLLDREKVPLLPRWKQEGWKSWEHAYSKSPKHAARIRRMFSTDLHFHQPA